MRAIPGFDGYYITESGDVWSFRPPNGKGLCKKPRRMKITLNKDGYLSVMLQHETGSVRRGIHQLILISYFGPCPNGMECRHLNGNKTDNRLENLCWGTKKQNGEDKVRHGNSLRGEDHNKAKLTDEQVLEIYRRSWNGETKRKLSNEFGVCTNTIYMIRMKQIWKHILN